MKIDVREIVREAVAETFNKAMFESYILDLACEKAQEIDWREVMDETLDLDHLIEDAIDELLAEVIEE